MKYADPTEKNVVSRTTQLSFPKDSDFTIVKNTWNKPISVFRLNTRSESSNDGSGTAWIFGVVVFLLSVIVVHALFELVVNGSSANINILSILGGTFYVSALIYFLISVLTATLSVGCFCSYIMRKLKRTSTDVTSDVLDAKLKLSEQKLEQVLGKELSKFALDQFVVDQGLKSISMKLEENREKTEKIADIWKEYEKALKKQNTALGLAEKKLEKIESRIAPKSFLDATSDIEKISGVGEKTAETLKSIGIEKVEDLLIENPNMIAKKTNISENTIAKIKATAQLLLIPGVSLKTLKFLQKAGVSSAEELANQNPIDLFKKVSIAAGKSKDKPTLQELAGHIRLAQYYVAHTLSIRTAPIVSFPEEITRS